MDVVDCRVVGERPVPVSHAWSGAEEGVGKVMPTYGSHVVSAREFGGRVAP